MSDLLSKGRLKMSETEWFVYTLVDYSTVCTFTLSSRSSYNRVLSYTNCKLAGQLDNR